VAVLFLMWTSCLFLLFWLGQDYVPGMYLPTMGQTVSIRPPDPQDRASHALVSENWLITYPWNYLQRPPRHHPLCYGATVPTVQSTVTETSRDRHENRRLANKGGHVVSPEALLDQQQISPVAFCDVLLSGPGTLQRPVIAQ